MNVVRRWAIGLVEPSASWSEMGSWVPLALARVGARMPRLMTGVPPGQEGVAAAFLASLACDGWPVPGGLVIRLTVVEMEEGLQSWSKATRATQTPPTARDEQWIHAPGWNQCLSWAGCQTSFCRTDRSTSKARAHATARIGLTGQHPTR